MGLNMCPNAIFYLTRKALKEIDFLNRIILTIFNSKKNRKSCILFEVFQST